MNKRLDRDFYQRDVLEVAPDLLGKAVVTPGLSGIITEVEAYRGAEDLACHARFGKTKRTEVMFGKAGLTYMYLIYGMYWMFNIVTGDRGMPQAVLIRGTKEISGPGKITKAFGFDKSFYGEDLVISKRLWIADVGVSVDMRSVLTSPRIGVAYADEWAKKEWRFILDA
jgi:DNA-3-methyladenine glycosylase